jgi:hypothetical protein
MLGLILCSNAVAQPNVKLPTLKEALAGDIVAKVRVRWSKVVDGKRAQVSILGGEAERLEPWLSDKPGSLKYDLAKNRELEKALKASKLPASQKHMSEAAADRTLELLADGPKEWEVIGRWSMPVKTWEKKYSGLFELLEPMFKQQLDTFGSMPGPPK